MYILNFVRSFIFFIIYSITYLMLTIALLPSIIFKKEEWASFVAIKWNTLVIFLLKKICKITYKVEGLEYFDINKNYIITSKHQSAWETYFFLYLFSNKNKQCASFVLKKELLKIPVFGWGLKACGNIAIDRNMGIQSLKYTIKEAKYRVLEQKRNLIIFPQGTRTPINATTQQYPYKAGFLAIIKELKTDLLPVAINTGKFWAKGQFVKTPGEIIIRILPSIKFSELELKNKNKIMENIEELIEKHSKELLNISK